MKDTVRNIIKHISIFFYYKKMNVIERVAYRLNFFFICLAILMSIVSNIVVLKTIYGWVDYIKGWSFAGAIMVAGVAVFVSGLVWTSCSFLRPLGRFIEKGDLDFMIIKPIDTQFLATSYRGDLEDVVRFVAGLILIIYSLFEFGFEGVLLFLVIIKLTILILCSVIIYYSVAVFVETTKFWTLKNTMTFSLYDMMISLSYFPVDIYTSKIVRTVLTFVVPIAFVSTILAKSVMIYNDWYYFGLAIIMALVFFVGSRFFWQLGLRKYTSSSS